MKKSRKKRNFIIGLVTVIAVALLFWGLNFLKGKNVLVNHRYFYALYEDVKGLEPSNSVLLNGKKIGQVDDVYFHPDLSGRLMVRFIISEDFPIPANSIARIESDLLGTKAIAIKLGDSKVKAASGDTLNAELATTIQEEVSAQMLPIKLKAENLMLSLDSVLAVIQYVFNENTRENLAKSFESIKVTIKNLEHTTYNIDTLVTYQRGRLASIMANVESITLNFRSNNEKLNNIITNFSDISDTLAQANLAETIHKANSALANFDEITQKINNGEGSMGMLINNDSLYLELENSARDLDLLLEDIRMNPHRYVHISVFGKNPKKNEYQAPEKQKGKKD